MFRKKILLVMLTGSLLFSTVLPAIGSDTEARIERPVRQSIDTRQATQDAEAKWRQDKEKLTLRFEKLQAEQKQLEASKATLAGDLESTRARIAAKEKQLSDIEQISSQIQPFLGEMVGVLKETVAGGSPFLLAEREKRIGNLDHLMNDPEVSVSEKYRKVMEALLVEAEYGCTIETYQESISVDGQRVLVDIFRLGRISLFYQCLDRQHCGFYNVATGGWQALPATYNPDIHAAIDMAAKRKPVELINLPLGRLVVK
ncbi:DUF3450 domain-containing protein [Desulfosarcina ovata]|uniref:DUF3450 domain-containing protein n=2 Tax=Desulfosarcina ovata TaxID=83564 RepID=A0A5K8AIE3_9BACT|nr:DUF3450 domain-containing protein [Desulfosarcina ovata]BBO82601.1 DUF3450 domain-containing protein [Desulfosarcina ovata subsp. sediminis]BBO92431.1 DUF3450 domain-containing protein [Desulfosarcina ovata subsp. ovata]